MPRGGKRQGAGRKAKHPVVIGGPTPPLPNTKAAYARLIAVLNADPVEDERTKDPEAASWRSIWDDLHPATRFNVRKFFYLMRDGNPVDTRIFINEKPLVEVNVSMAEIVRGVRERKQAYEKGKK